jgi:hypothetical protein
VPSKCADADVPGERKDWRTPGFDADECGEGWLNDGRIGPSGYVPGVTGDDGWDS